MNSILDNFRLNNEKEHHQTVIDSIDKGVVFKGTNLWILVFAIFIASLGLNVNSTAVIIGAMLVSPLMGPIMGLGVGMAINDLALLRKALFNYLFAAGVGLATSTIYFLLSPINEAHSEILARTSPNIYDVLIAFFGGLAGILATSSKQKGNVIPGVAIATALMPPLCTAGYGLATFQLHFFVGAFYLFLINTVFIALSTLITLRFLKYPFKHLPNPRDEINAKRIVWFVVAITLLPSIYFGYDLVQQNKFTSAVKYFISKEANLKGDYLLNKNIDFKNKSIKLTFGGRKIKSYEIDSLKNKLKEYNLDGTSLEIKQGFASLGDIKNNEQFNQMATALQAMESELKVLHSKLDCLTPDTIYSK
ncbi:MAG: TIGR00341 family protein [Saprospiraceae bacterium]